MMKWKSWKGFDNRGWNACLGVVREFEIPETGPKRKLLDAAERHVVERGFDVVSVRDITGAAGANVAAVNYHFGSREGLLALVVRHVMEPLNEKRLNVLGGLKGGMEEIVGGYVRGLLGAAAESGMDMLFYMRLVGRVVVLPDEALTGEMAETRGLVSARFCEAIVRNISKSRADEVGLAWRFYEMGLGQALVNLREGDDPAVLAGQWIEIGVRIFGQVKEGGKAKKADNQGMLFEF
jgi:AcrR family transcriptional regulator